MQYVNTKVPVPKPYAQTEWGISSSSQRPPALTVTTRRMLISVRPPSPRQPVMP